MSVELKCSVSDVEDSYIPGVKIITMQCDRGQIKMDIHRDLNPVEKGGTINVGIYKYKPDYVKGVDFVAHGYVVTKRRQDGITKIYISLWGYIVIISTSDDTIESMFGPMDKVYIKLWK